MKMMTLLVVAMLAAAVVANPVNREVVHQGEVVDMVTGRLPAVNVEHAFTHACPEAPAFEGVEYTSVLEVSLKEGVQNALTATIAAEADGEALWSFGADDETFVVSSDDASWPASGVFHLAVAGSAPAEYALRAACRHVKKPAASRAVGVASAEAALGTVALTNGVAVNGTVTKTADQLYTFAVPAAGCIVTLSLTFIEGDPDLYASTNVTHPSPDSNMWSSAYWGDDEIYIPNAPHATINVAVKAYTDQAIFTMLAVAECANHEIEVALADGIPYGYSGAMRFTFTTHSSHSNIAIEVTPESGDPDLYVSVGKLPTPGDAQWSSAAYGADLLEISSNDANFCSAAECVYHILVNPFGIHPEDTVYTITASTGTAELQAGIPYEGQAAAGEYVYFTLPSSLSASEDLTVSVTARQGDPDLFVSTTEPHPNRTTAQWYSRMVGSDAVTVLATDKHACHDCTYHFAVQCYSEECQFTVVASFSEPEFLVDGSPVSGDVPAGALRGFVAVVDREAAHLTFTLTDVFGMCDMYVNLGSAATRQNYTDATFWYEDDQSAEVTIPDGPCNPAHPDLQRCVYYVSVAGVSNCSFSLVMTEGTDRSATELEDGVPIEADAVAGSSNYYRFHNEGATTVRFRVTTLSGDPDLYVTVPPNANPRPDASNANLTSTYYGDDMVETLEAVDGVYFASVYAFTNVSYTIAVETATDATPSYVVLEDGQQQTVDVPSHEYRYFLVTLENDHGDFEFRSSCMYGSAQLYMSDVDYFPTFTQFTWSGIDSISLRKEDIEAGQYYVGLYAFEESECTVSAVSITGEEIVTLEDGVPMRGHLDTTSQCHYYRYYHSGVTNQGVSIRLTPVSGDTDLFVSTETHYPNATTHDWISNSFNTELITVDPSDPHYCVGCDFFIGACAYQDNTTYTVAVTEVNILYLMNGEGQRGQVARDKYQHFNFFWVSEASTIRFTLETLTGSSHAGNAELFVSRGDAAQFPTKERHDHSATMNRGRATMVLDQPNNPDGCNEYACIYKISVYGLEYTDFLLTASA